MSGTPQHDPYGQSPYGQNPYAQGPDAAAPGAAAQAPYGQPPVSTPTAGASADGQAPAPAYGQAPAPAYGQQPAPGEGQQSPQGWPGAEAPRPQRPSSITAAFWLILSAGALVLLSTVLGALALSTPEGRAVMDSAMEEQYAQAGLPADQIAQMRDMVGQAMPAIMGAIVLLGVLLFLGYLLVAWKIRSGSRAARTVGTVLAGLSVLLLLGTLASGGFGWFDILWVLLGVAGIALAYRKDATEFMRLRAWEKAARR